MKYTIATGKLEKVIGYQPDGVTLSSEDGLINDKTKVSNIEGIFVDHQENIYFSESIYNRIRAIKKDTLKTILSNNSLEISRDENIFGPTSIYNDDYGNIYFADTQNFKIKKFDFCEKKISTIVGNGGFKFNEDGLPLDQSLYYPRYLRFYGNKLYFTENGLVRVFDPFRQPKKFTIFPNPTSSFVKIKGNQDEEVISIEIINSIGQKIFEMNEFIPKSKEINISNIRPGQYYLNIYDQFKYKLETHRLFIVQ